MLQLPKIEKIFIGMLVFVPVSILLAIFTKNMTLVFISSILAIIPLARILGYCSNEIAMQTNPTISGLISATFGNIIELIIAILALRRGLVEVVQGSIVGSIIGNILLLIGLSLFVGGLKYKHQHFNTKAAGVASTMLIIVVVGLSIPSVYAFAGGNPSHIHVLSDAVAVVMALTYIAGLIFSLHTHKDMFDATDEMKALHHTPTLTPKAAAIWLGIATIVVAIISELLVNGIEGAALSLGISHTFIGVVIIAILTNIAEKSNAIQFALQNKLDISLEIGTSSANQIALFVVPILVLISQVFHYGFSLVFTMFEVISIVLAVMIVNYLSSDGTCNWLEGAQLVSVYLIIAIVFFFV
jgi:Ca2+:H+ antiporter